MIAPCLVHQLRGDRTFPIADTYRFTDTIVRLEQGAIAYNPVRLTKNQPMPVVEAKVYVEYRSGGYWIAGSRISLDSIVYAFRNGLSPESIVQSFPLLTLEQVYGAIAFYLANRAEIDTYLLEEEAAFDTMPQPLQAEDPVLYGKLMSAY